MTNEWDSPVAGLARPRRRVSVGALLVGIALGVFLTAAAAVAFLIWRHRDNTPRLAQTAFDAARERWQAHRVANYDADIELSGAQQASIHVEVRDHKVAAMSYNGLPPRRQATWDAWSVDGLFEMIAVELENAQEPERAYGVSDPSQVVLRAEFDAELGFPRKFQRVVMGTDGGPGSTEIRWELTRFERK